MLLAWSFFDCKTEDIIAYVLQSEKKVDQVIVLERSNKHIQAPEVSWTKPFKATYTKKE